MGQRPGRLARLTCGVVAVLGVGFPDSGLSSTKGWTDTTLCAVACVGDKGWSNGPAAAVAGSGGSAIGAATFLHADGVFGARIEPLPGGISRSLIARRRLPFLLLTVSSTGEACAGSGPVDRARDSARWIVSCRAENSTSWVESARLAPDAIVADDLLPTGPAMAFAPDSSRLIVAWISSGSIWVATRSSGVWGSPVRVGGPFATVDGLELRVPSRGPSAVVAWSSASPSGPQAGAFAAEVDGVWSSPTPLPVFRELGEGLDRALAASGALFTSRRAAPVRTDGKVSEVTIRTIGAAQRLRVSTGDGRTIPFRGPTSWTNGVGAASPTIVGAGAARATFAIWTSKRRLRLGLVTLKNVTACDDLPLEIDDPGPLGAARTNKDLLLLLARRDQLHLLRTPAASLIRRCGSTGAR